MRERSSTGGEAALRVVGLVEGVSARYEYYLDVFFIACYILGRLRDPVSIPCLVSKLEKFGEILSRRSERGMERWERYLIRIARFPLKSAVDALIRIGEGAVQPLIGLLGSEHPETRKYAAYALGKIGSRAAIPALRNIFQNGEEAELVREAAGRALLQIDPEAAETVQADSLTPAEDPTEQPGIELDLETIKRYYRSPDDLGPPSEYKLSVSLYEYVKEVIRFRDYVKDIKNWEAPFYPEILELNLPQEIKIVEEVERMDGRFLPCLCGEYLEWAYVKSLSKRKREQESGGYYYRIIDVMCIYCNNCKRYTGVEVSFNNAHPEQTEFLWFYLPRFPKQTELITQEELEKKPLTLEDITTTTKQETRNLKWSHQFHNRVNCCFVGDVDGDGKNEVIAGSTDETLKAFDGKTGSLKWSHQFDDTVYRCFVGDTDGDGKNEVVVGCGDNTLSVLNGKTGGLKWSHQFDDCVFCCFVGDVDGDGRSEVIAGSWDNTFRVFDGKTGGLKWSRLFDDAVVCCFVGDVDGDGKNEVIVGSNEGTLKVFDFTKSYGEDTGMMW